MGTQPTIRLVVSDWDNTIMGLFGEGMRTAEVGLQKLSFVKVLDQAAKQMFTPSVSELHALKTLQAAYFSKANISETDVKAAQTALSSRLQAARDVIEDDAKRIAADKDDKGKAKTPIVDYVFHDFRKFIQACPSLSEIKHPECQKYLEQVAYDVSKERLELAQLYDGFIDTIKAVKAAGALFCVYSDAMEGMLAYRMFLGDKAQELPSLLDGIVCMPNEKGPAKPLTTEQSEYFALISDKFIGRHIEGGKKPNPDRLRAIAAHFRIPEENVLMIGDTRADFISALPPENHPAHRLTTNPIHFALQGEGAHLTDAEIALNNRIGDTRFTFVFEQTVDELKKGTPEKWFAAGYVNILNSWHDVAKLYNFAPAATGTPKPPVVAARTTQPCLA